MEKIDVLSVVWWQMKEKKRSEWRKEMPCDDVV
jgi:hypothetical protein